MRERLAQIAGARWDAVVVGAGPAGTLCARRLALMGRRVLLVERSEFPRWKVCGACLGVSGVRTLEREGLGHLLGSLGATPVAVTRLAWRGRSARVPMRGMVTVSRRGMDLGLARAAEDAGVVFVQGVRADWDEPDGPVSGPVGVRLHAGEHATEVVAGSLVIAGGLRASLANGIDGAAVRAGSWIGLGVSAPAEEIEECERGELMMAIGSRGYVGRIVTEDGVANWAAAVDPGSLRAHGGAAGAVRAICDEAGFGVDVPEAGWLGTPALSRRTPAQRGCVYRVGDAAGYVEPITGEGMSWALLGASALARVLEGALSSGRHDPVWASRHASLLRLRRARCGMVARSMRSPTALRAAFAMFGSGGPARAAVVNRLVGAPGFEGGVS